MTNRRKIIVRIATSADGCIARPNGDLDWLTSHRAPKGFYGFDAFMKSVDTELLGRKTLRFADGRSVHDCWDAPAAERHGKNADYENSTP